MSADEERLWKISEICERWHVTPRTVRRWRKSGRLRTVRIGGALRVRDSGLRAAMSEDDINTDTETSDKSNSDDESTN